MHSYHVAQGVLFQELDGESVLLNLKTELYFALDPVGTRAWRLLEETHSIDATVAALLPAFEVEESTLRADIESLVRQLVVKGLLVEQAAGADGNGI